MTAIEGILFAVSAGFAVIVVATILVIVGVRYEERNRTLTHQHPPTITSMLTRCVLRTYAHPSREEHDKRAADQQDRRDRHDLR